MHPPHKADEVDIIMSMCPNSVLRAKGFTPQLPPRNNIEKANEEEDPSLTDSQLLTEGKALLVAESRAPV